MNLFVLATYAGAFVAGGFFYHIVATKVLGYAKQAANTVTTAASDAAKKI